MKIDQIEKTGFDETYFQELEPILSEEQIPTRHSTKTSLTLDEVFDQDIVEGFSTDSAPASPANVPLSSSFFNKILSWWKTPEDILPSPSKRPDSSTIAKVDPISSVPILEAPDEIPPDLEAAKIPFIPKITKAKNLLTPSEIGEGLSLMSEQTIESILFIIFKAQIELEKDNANIAEKTFSKFLDFQKIQQKVLQEIKDKLMSDQKVAGYFQTAQNIALAANFLSGIVTVAAQFGMKNVVQSFIIQLFGPIAGNVLITVLNPAATAGLAGLTSASKAYFQRVMNQHKAQHESYTHQDQYYNDRVDDSRNRLMTIAEMDSVFKEHWIRLLKRSDKLRKIILKK